MKFQSKRQALVQKAQGILDLADSEERALTDDERQAYDETLAKIEQHDQDIERRQSLEGLAQNGQPVAGGLGRVPGDIGLDEKEKRQYSILKAIKASVDGDWSQAPLELEASKAVEKRVGKPASSFYIPTDIQGAGKRAAVTTTVGADIIQDTLMTQDFIGMLRNKMVVKQAGARVLGDLTGQIVSIPKQTGGATLYWVAEDGDITESNQTFSDVNLSPKTAGALSSITRLMLIESSVDVENLVRDDLIQTLALGLDYAALNGSGSSNQPTGVASTSGINDPSVSALAWSDVVKFETMVASDNADLGALAYITSPKVRGHWKVTPKVASTGAPFIWQNGTVNDYPCYVTNQCSDILGGSTNESQVFFGNWNDLIIAMWGGIDILVDPYTYAKKGRIQLVAMVNVDLGVRNAVSFAYDTVAI